MNSYGLAQHQSFSKNNYQADVSASLDTLVADPVLLDLNREESESGSSCVPSLELDLTQDSSPLDPSPTTSQYFPMQSTLPHSDRTHSHATMKTFLPSQDSGLGIRTDENSFFSNYDPYNTDSSDRLQFDNEQSHPRGGRHNQLASPFDEHYYTTVSGWPTYDSTILPNNIAPTPYSSTPDNGFYRSSNGFGHSNYLTPQATLNNTPLQYLSTPNGQFRRPLMRHNSTSSVITPNNVAMDFPTTGSMEASPYSWTTQAETPLWHDNCEDETHAHRKISDYVGYRQINPSPQVTEAGPDTIIPLSVSNRRKPPMRPSFSENCVRTCSSPARSRAMSMAQVEGQQYVNGMPVQQQLPLPPLPPSILVRTPHLQAQNLILSHSQTGNPMYRRPRSMSNTPQRWRRPSSPPPSDLNNPNTPYLTPVRQDPTFPGDLYTPRYKRRTSGGRWEGWCGYCQPGRWLDLKNSRFWEDKLRNHGICAKTKIRFAEPERIRWVTMDGKVCQAVGASLEVGDQGTDQKKREGLCGVCGEWVAMDGMRTKARDRAVGWWMHAYKCHDHDQSAEQKSGVAAL